MKILHGIDSSRESINILQGICIVAVVTDVLLTKIKKYKNHKENKKQINKYSKEEPTASLC